MGLYVFGASKSIIEGLCGSLAFGPHGGGACLGVGGYEVIVPLVHPSRVVGGPGLEHLLASHRYGLIKMLKGRVEV